MSKELEKLKEIGAQKISEKTHIARSHIQAVIHESFEDLKKIQFLGFVSILEREYKMDLSELRAHGLEYFSDEKYSLKQDMFKAPKDKQRSFSVISFFILVIVAIAIYYGYTSRENIQTDISSVEAISIKTPEANNSDMIVDENGEEEAAEIEVSDAEENQTVESASEINSSEQESVLEEKAIEKSAPVVLKEEKLQENSTTQLSLKLVTTQRLWVGYIDANTYKKGQKLIDKELSLDPSKSWLLSLGHGNVTVYVNGEETEFHSPKHLYLFYKDNKLQQVNYIKFKELNRGRLW